jgi:hypothetical protein
LEEQIFAECKKYFASCSRSDIQLSEEVASDSPAAVFNFQQHKGARLKWYRSLKGTHRTKFAKNKNSSVGFFLHAKAIPVYGCSLVVSFGMGGLETLIWNRIVRTRYPKWLSSPVFAVAEMTIGKLPPEFATLEFVTKIKSTILLEHHIR